MKLLFLLLWGRKNRLIWCPFCSLEEIVRKERRIQVVNGSPGPREVAWRVNLSPFSPVST